MCLAMAVVAGVSWGQVRPAATPVEIVRQAVNYEEKANHDPAKFMFRDRKQTPHGTSTKLMVETKEAMAGMVIAYDDKPLGPGARQAELARVERFVRDPEELRKKQKQEKEDADRISRIVRALPDAFVFVADGQEPGKPGLGTPGEPLDRFQFSPNPNYDPPSRVEQVLTGMRGVLLIDPVRHRIARIDGTLAKDVTFGWGILGHLDRGGHFLVEEGVVDEEHWDITRMSLSFTGKVLLFKHIEIQSNEVYSGYRPVPQDLTFAQAVEMLKKQQGELAENEQHSGKAD